MFELHKRQTKNALGDWDEIIFYSCSFKHSCFQVTMTGYYEFVGGMIIRIS